MVWSVNQNINSDYKTTSNEPQNMIHNIFFPLFQENCKKDNNIVAALAWVPWVPWNPWNFIEGFRNPWNLKRLLSRCNKTKCLNYNFFLRNLVKWGIFTSFSTWRSYSPLSFALGIHEFEIQAQALLSDTTKYTSLVLTYVL